MSFLDYNVVNYKFNYLPENNNTSVSGIYGILSKNSNAIVKNNSFNLSGYATLLTDNSYSIFDSNKISANLATINNNSFLTTLSNDLNTKSLCVKNYEILKTFNNSFIDFPSKLIQCEDEASLSGTGNEHWTSYLVNNGLIYSLSNDNRNNIFYYNKNVIEIELEEKNYVKDDITNILNKYPKNLNGKTLNIVFNHGTKFTEPIEISNFYNGTVILSGNIDEVYGFPEVEFERN